MAWQSLSGMGGGGNGGGNGGGEGAQQQNPPQGTEYTLQGICLSYQLSVSIRGC
jgi:striatin 1/3/4